MIRCRFGLVLLLLLLTLGILSSLYMGSRHSSTARTVEAAGKQALAGNWDRAEELAGKALIQWEKSRHLSAALTDHEPMEQIDSQFAQLQIFAQCREALSFASLCAQLSCCLEALADAQILTLRNLL